MTLELLEYLDFPRHGYVEPTRSVRAPGYGFDHDVRIWLPPSYKHHTEQHYPTLWVTDNTLEYAQIALQGAPANAPELIVVAVGGSRELSWTEFQRRRTYDFLPDRALLTEPQDGDYPADSDDASIGGAASFRDFLIDTLRPMLAEEYRMDPADHGLAGYSGGAMFALYVLFTRPEAFSKYLIGGAADGVDYLRLEREYAATHEDLVARVFIGAGAAEMTDSLGARARVLSTTARVVEALTVRGYPSLELSATVLPGHDHGTAAPLLYIEGVRALWRGQIRKPERAAFEQIWAELNSDTRSRASTAP